MTPSIQAVTAYGVQIPRSFASAKIAKDWAETYGRITFPGCRVLTPTKKGFRTIWKDVSGVLS